MADNWWIGDDNPYNAYRQPTAKPYEQTWRDKLAAALMGQSKSKARRDFVSGALGSTGLGTTGMGLVDLTPAGIPLAGNESRKDFNEGNYAGSLMNAMAMIPAVKPGAAVAKAAANSIADLPMDFASRMKRAKKMGYDTKNVYYHGTDNPNITEFMDWTPDYKTRGVYVAKDPSIAEVYARKNHDLTGEGAPNLMPLFVKKGAITGPTGSGYYNIADPSAVRSVNAKFDPNNKDSRNILASILAASLLGGGALGVAMPSNDKPQGGI